MFDGAFSAQLMFTHHRVSTTAGSASEIAAWFSSQIPGLEAQANDLRLIQVLHDAEFNGSVAWMQDAGFWLELDDRKWECATWPEAERWFRAAGNSVLGGLL